MTRQEAYVCAKCDYMGKVKKKVKDSIFIEIVLWLTFIVPGLVYSLWRETNRYKACPKCGSTDLLPIDPP